MSLSGHQSAAMASDVWLTPPEILAALGAFDLDPCAAPEPRPWATATEHWIKEQDGLSRPWHGRVWCNPPFGREAALWARRMAEHGKGTLLVPARTETAMFYESVWPCANGVLFLKGRPHFHRQDGSRAPFNSGAPIALIAYGTTDLAALIRCKLGQLVMWAK